MSTSAPHLTAEVMPAKVGSRTKWDALAVSTAVGGLLSSLFPDFKVRTFDLAASDFKTLYASAWCFARSLDAYSTANIANVFHQQGVLLPPNWFAHSAVYPPFTLLIMTPLTWLPMVAAAWLCLLAAAASFTLALYAVVGMAAERYALSLPWRLGVIGVAVALPLLSFGLMGLNVSVVVSALVMAVILAKRRQARWRPVAYALALLLKPHIAVWLIPALLLTGDQDDRRTALRATGACTLLVLVMAAVATFEPHLAMQFAGYRSVLNAELQAGSMSPGSRATDLVPAQIVSLDSLLGYWLPQAAARPALTAGALLLLACTLTLTAFRKQRPLNWTERLLLLNGWLAFGLIATYHRAHDGLALYTILPWMAWRLRTWRQHRPVGLIVPVCLLAGFVVLSTPPPDGALTWLADHSWGDDLARLLLFRQAALGACVVAVTLTLLGVSRRPNKPGLLRPGDRLVGGL